nr:AbrB family transcriptional regulator [Acuticoccus mangrovi]
MTLPTPGLRLALLAEGARLLGIYCVTALTGYVFWRVGAPLPWMIGPLVAAAAMSMSGITLRIPVKTRPFGQIVIATSVGFFFTPHAVEAALDSLPILLGSAVMTAILGYATSVLLARFTGLDRISAFLASVPNGPVEMANLAHHYGRDPGPIAFAQTLRITAIVVFVPIVIYMIHGQFERPTSFEPAPFRPLALVLVACVGYFAARVGKLVRLSNPYFLGPLAFSAALTAFDVPLAHYPVPMLWGAQVLLGTWLGATFRRELLERAGQLVLVLFLTTILFIAVCTIGAASLALVVDMPWESLVLGSAPGGVTEMALTASVLGQDVALITAFHLIRIFLIMPNIPWVIARIHKAHPEKGT